MQETEIMEAWTQVLDDRDGEDAENIHQNIKVEDDKSEFDCKTSQTTYYPTQAFVTLSKVQDMIAAEIENRYSAVTILC